MYKRISTDKHCMWDTRHDVIPLATLENEEGHRLQIVKEDGCYYVLSKQENGVFHQTGAISQEIIKILAILEGLIINGEN